MHRHKKAGLHLRSGVNANAGIALQPIHWANWEWCIHFDETKNPTARAKRSLPASHAMFAVCDCVIVSVAAGPRSSLAALRTPPSITASTMQGGSCASAQASTTWCTVRAAQRTAVRGRIRHDLPMQADVRRRWGGRAHGARGGGRRATSFHATAAARPAHALRQFAARQCIAPKRARGHAEKNPHVKEGWRLWRAGIPLGR